MSKFAFTIEEVAAACNADNERFAHPATFASTVEVRYFIHNTLRSNRESIQASGLIMHAPFQDGNWKEIGTTMRGPKGIYVFPLGDKPTVTDPFVVGCQYGGDEQNQIPGHEGEPMDHWLVDAQNIPREIDPDFLYAMRLTENVPPERLTLLTDLVDESKGHPLPKPSTTIFDMIDKLFGSPSDYRDDPYYDRDSERY